MVGTHRTDSRGGRGTRRWLHVPLLGTLTAFWTCLRWLRSPRGERAGKGAPRLGVLVDGFMLDGVLMAERPGFEFDEDRDGEVRTEAWRATGTDSTRRIK